MFISKCSASLDFQRELQIFMNIFFLLVLIWSLFNVDAQEAVICARAL